MNASRASALVTLLLIGAPGLGGNANAQPPGLLECRAIGRDAERLRCYDALANPAPAPAAVLPPQPAQPAPPVAAAPAAPVAAAPVAAPPPAAAAAAEFGAETIQRKPSQDKPEPAVLKARIVGRVADTRKGERYTLDNGQVWTNVDDRNVMLNLDNPEITIDRSFTGTYWLKVEGRNVRIKVRRIK